MHEVKVDGYRGQLQLRPRGHRTRVLPPRQRLDAAVGVDRARSGAKSPLSLADPLRFESVLRPFQRVERRGKAVAAIDKTKAI